MKLLFLSWRDIKNPKAGGAEVFTHEMLRRLVEKGFEVNHISPLFPEADSQEDIDGVNYLRAGNLLSVIKFARDHHRRNEYDLVVDQSNTHQFFTPLWLKKNQKQAFFIHQFTREIWWHNCRFPFSLIGYLMEPVIIKLHKDKPVLTVSNSTKNDLVNYGFKDEKIEILPEGIEFTTWAKDELHQKEKDFTFIYVGRFVKYKGVEDAIKAFAMFVKKYPDSKLWLVGKVKPKYQQELIRLINKLGVSDKVVFWGFVSAEKKLELMSRAHTIVVPSQREGWGLIVTEANAVGTPAVVYNSPGLRDAVKNHETGLVCEHNSPHGLLREFMILKESPALYQLLRRNAYEWSKEFHWDNTGDAAFDAIERIMAALIAEEKQKDPDSKSV